MVRRLQRKLVLITSGVVFCILLSVVGLSAFMNFFYAAQRASYVLDYICRNGGVLPSDFDEEDENEFHINDLTEESMFQVRYFSVFIDEDGSVKSSNLSSIATVTEDEAVEMAGDIMEYFSPIGHFRSDRTIYSYERKDQEDGTTMIVVMDSSFLYSSAYNYFKFSALFGCGCLIAFAFLVSVFSRRVLKPIIQSMEAQREFITNAGHELKTPVAIISANAEVLEMMNGSSEPVDNIRAQSIRLTQLIDELIALSRIGEKRDITLNQVEVSPIAAEVARSFEAVAVNAGKELKYSIEEGISVKAEEKGLREIMNILLDNAVKYCDDGGTITFELMGRTRNRSGLRLVVTNDYAEGLGMDFSRFFDRFYRQDTSHNSTKEGYGIGLSMAKSLTECFRGKIRVGYRNGRIIFILTLG